MDLSLWASQKYLGTRTKKYFSHFGKEQAFAPGNSRLVGAHRKVCNPSSTYQYGIKTGYGYCS